MRQYELTYLISDNVPEAELNKVTGKVGGYVTGLGGKILKEEIWGRRKLAYPIKKQDFATYITLNFDLPADKAGEFERNLFLSSKIVRHLMIVKDYGTEALTLTAEELTGTEEITKATGGEKSFEAVVGETEESKDLMAVRGEDESSSAEASEDKKEIIEHEEVASEVAEEPKEEIIEEKISEEKKVEEKPVKKAAKASVKKEEKADKEESKEKPKAKPAKKEKKPEDEADRLSKLDKELDDILGDDL